jgi:hypothetical protein
MALMDTDEKFHGELYQKSVCLFPRWRSTVQSSREVWIGTTDFGYKSHHKALKSLGVLNNKHIPEVYLKIQEMFDSKYSLVSSIQMDT